MGKVSGDLYGLDLSKHQRRDSSNLTSAKLILWVIHTNDERYAELGRGVSQCPCLGLTKDRGSLIQDEGGEYAPPKGV